MIVVIGIFPPVFFLQSKGLKQWHLLTFFITALIGTHGYSASNLSFEVKTLEDANWQATDVTISVALDQDYDQFKVTIGTLRLLEQDIDIKQLVIDCQQGKASDDEVSCTKGKVSLIINEEKLTAHNTAFSWNQTTNTLKLSVPDIRYFGIRLATTGTWREGKWAAKLTTRPIKLTGRALRQIAPLQLFIPNLSSGSVHLNLSLKGEYERLKSSNWMVGFDQVTFADSADQFVGEDLSGKWVGSLKSTRSNSWNGTSQLEVNGGALLTPYTYFEPGTHPVRFQTKFETKADLDSLQLSHIRFSQQKLLEVTGEASIDLKFGELIHLKFNTSRFDIADVYLSNIQPVMTNPAFESLEVMGKATVNGLLDAVNGTRVNITVNDVDLEQGLNEGEQSQSNLALYGLNGSIYWSDTDTPKASQIEWQSAELFGSIPIGGAKLSVQLKDQTVKLLQATPIPIFDGQFVVDELKMSIEGKSSEEQFEFKGYLSPISMEQFSQAVGWPILSGQLSGMIPRIRYQNDVLKVEGITQIRLFDGSVLLKDLQLEGLFGALPALTGLVELKNIDLEALTRTFSFGKITGKLEGRIDDLRLENWAPVSFDAWFATPLDDESRHRISQKAVDNLSNLGGAGVSGALSRSFMRFFEEFSYARLGIKCKLEGNICTMGGIEEAERGYYLVKGGGLPRIDILGFNQRTDWQQLLNKLERITTGGSVVIE